jgi:Kef-type K+ transport system membrane component KefB
VGVTSGLETLFVVALVAALAPVVVAVLPGPRIPQVVIFLLGGVLIGPHGLGLANTASITLLSNIGLGFLFLLAGYELDPRLLRQRPGQLALIGWAVTAVLAVGVVAALGSTGYIHDFVPVGLALTTTALGTLLPILQDNHMLGGKFGAYVMAAGAVGELLPTIAISVFLTQHDHFAALASVGLVGLLALGLSFVPRVTRNRRLRGIITESQDSTGQITLRWTTVLLFLLLTIASRFGLDVVLGALMAGIVLRGWTRQMNMDTTGLENKFDAVGYGIFIPIFFVASGMTLDLKAIGHDPLRVVLFFLLLLVVRGLPSLLIYRRVLSLRQRAQMTFITATTMPLLIALAEIGKRDGVMLPSTSAALVGAGVLSVLIYPPIAVALSRGSRPADAAPAALAEAAGGSREGPASQDSGELAGDGLPPASGRLPEGRDALPDPDAHGGGAPGPATAP